MQETRCRGAGGDVMQGVGTASMALGTIVPHLVGSRDGPLCPAHGGTLWKVLGERLPPSPLSVACLWLLAGQGAASKEEGGGSFPPAVPGAVRARLIPAEQHACFWTRVICVTPGANAVTRQRSGQGDAAA